MRTPVKRHLLTGALILVPIVLTGYCFLLLLQLVNNSLSIPIGRFLVSVINSTAGTSFMDVSAFWASVIGIGLILLLTYLVGLAGTSLMGKQVFLAAEGIIEQIPVFKTVYATMKQVVTELSPGERKSFRKVVLVAGDGGKYNVGFLIGSSRIGDADVRSVYLPTNHLWFGEVRIVPAADVHETDMTTEQGISFILSCGAAVPPTLTKRT